MDIQCWCFNLSPLSLTDEVSRDTSELLEETRKETRTLKQWIAEENEDPQGPISKDKKVDDMSLSELQQECLFLRSRLRLIYTEKLAKNSRWEVAMNYFPLSALRNEASGLPSDGLTLGDGTSSEEVARKRLNR